MTSYHLVPLSYQKQLREERFYLALAWETGKYVILEKSFVKRSNERPRFRLRLVMFGYRVSPASLHRLQATDTPALRTLNIGTLDPLPTKFVLRIVISGFVTPGVLSRRLTLKLQAWNRAARVSDAAIDDARLLVCAPAIATRGNRKRPAKFVSSDPRAQNGKID